MPGETGMSKPTPWIAVVTGAGRGIGEATARRLCADGAAVGMLDRDVDAVTDVADDLRAAGHQVLAVSTDVRVAAEVEAAVRSVVETFGGLDAVVNNAGVNARFDAVTMSEDDWDSVFAVDLKSVWFVTRAALPYLLESSRGAVVNISSIHARLTSTGVFPYPAAKAAVEGLTRSLALDYGPRGVRVNAVAPGWTRTALVEEWLALQDDPDQALADIVSVSPLGHLVEPADVAAVVAFLLGPGARAVTGAVVAVDCGMSARAAF